MLRFMKVPPTTYMLEYQHGRIRREGAGLSFFYWEPTTTTFAMRNPTPPMPAQDNHNTQGAHSQLGPSRITDAASRGKTAAGRKGRPNGLTLLNLYVSSHNADQPRLSGDKMSAE